MPDAIGSVRIDTSLDNSGISKDITKTEKELQRLKRQFESNGMTIQRNEAAAKKLREQIDAIAQGDKRPASLIAMEAEWRRVNIEVEKADIAFQGLVQRQDELETQAQAATDLGLTKQAERLRNEIVAMNPVIDEAGRRFDELFAKSSSLYGKINELKLNPQLSIEAKSLADRLKIVENNLQMSRGRADELRQQMQHTYDQGVKPTQKSFSQVLSTLSKMVPKIKLFNFFSKSVGDHTRKAAHGMQSMAVRLKSIVQGALVFNVISKALRVLTDQFGKVLKANQRFAQSWNNIKVNLLTAFAPIWEVLQPKIISFMHTLEAATQIVAKFVAALFGKTYQQAKNSAKALYDTANATDKEASSIKDVADEAKKAQKQLAGFDDINQLTANTAAEAASELADQADATDGLDFGAGSEVDTSWFDKLLDLANQAVDKFYGLGFALGEAINHGLRSIDWDAAIAKAESAAQKIASFLNGLVDGIDWDLVGYSLAQGLNTALTFMYTFMSTFNWGNFGTAIAQFLNSAIRNINWELLGKTLASGWVAAIDFLYNFVTTFDWRAFGEAVATSVNAWFEAIDWAKAATTISEGILGLLESLIAFIETVDWVAVGQAIGDFLANIDWGEILASVGQAVGAALGGIFAAIWVALGADADEVAEAFANLMQWLEDNREVLGAVVAVVGALVIAFGLLASIISTVVTVVKALSAVKTALTVVAGLLGTSLGSLVGTIGLVVAAIAALIVIIVALIYYWDDIKAAASKAWDGIKGVWEKVSVWFNKTVVEPIKNFFSDLWDEIKQIWTEPAEWFNQRVWQPLLNDLKTFANFFIGIWNGLVGAFESGLNFIIEGINAFAKGLDKLVRGASDLLNKAGFNVNWSVSPIPTVKFPRVPALATGAVLPPNSEFLAILGDQKHGRNVEAPEGLIDEIVSNRINELGDRLVAALEKSNGSGGGNAEMTLDGRTFARLILPYIQEENARIGVRMSKNPTF